MKFSELKSCPFCDCDEFYTTEYVYGTIRYKERFDGNEAHNEELYDYLNTKNYSGRVYCVDCGKYLGNRDTDKLGVNAEKSLNKGTER